ncbi:MAG: serine/threonine-protein kinase [Myxococcota bacterium]
MSTIDATASQEGMAWLAEPSEVGRLDDPDVTLDASDGEVATERLTSLGRFRVLGRLGRGGMGVVYRAYDPRLDRHVAIKLLLHEGKPDEYTRLQREAQAMARVSHPNVAAVFETGRAGSRSFIVMELIDGPPLDQWLQWRKRRVDEVLDVFLQAGRALVAAHQAGLVHRDFKPGNVMVGRDGRVRVLDFGLARATVPVTGELGDSGISLSIVPRRLERLWNQPLTQTRGLLGTPAYMAPEQLRGQVGTERSDQFSFCVALYEALLGHHPFMDNLDWRAMAYRIIAGELPELSHDDGAIPLPLQQVLRRGLAQDPQCRFASMEALVQALEHTRPSRRRRRFPLRGAKAMGLVGLLLTGVGLGVIATTGEAEPPCDPEARLAEVWGVEQRERVRRSPRSGAASSVDPSWAHVTAQLDDYAQQWVVAHERICESMRRPAAVAPTDDLAMRCLERRREELRELVDVLAGPDDIVAGSALTAVGGLLPISLCEASAYLESMVSLPEDAELAATVAEHRQDLQHAEALHRAGRFAEALTVIEAVVHDTRSLGYPPLQAEVSMWRGLVEQRLGEASSAEANLEQAYFLAKGVEHRSIAQRAAVELVFVNGTMLGHHDRAHVWARHARSELESGGDPVVQARYHEVVGGLLERQGRYAEALESNRRALEARRALLGPTHIEIGRALYNVGVVYFYWGRPEHAAESFEQAADMILRAAGERHPFYAQSLGAWGDCLRLLGRLDEARRHLERAVALLEELGVSKAPSMAEALVALGDVLVAQQELFAADDCYRRALSIHERAGGERDRMAILDRMGRLALTQGRADLAQRHFLRALEQGREALGEDDPWLAPALRGLGKVSFRHGAYRKAQVLLRRALGLLERQWGMDDPRVAEVREELLDAIVREGQADGLTSLPPKDAVVAAWARFTLAQARWRVGDRARAIALLQQVAQQSERRGPAGQPLRRALAQWVEAHEIDASAARPSR